MPVPGKGHKEKQVFIFRKKTLSIFYLSPLAGTRQDL
jgi:hypothetical protein